MPKLVVFSQLVSCHNIIHTTVAVCYYGCLVGTLDTYAALMDGLLLKVCAAIQV
jgi:hypothetical protein